MTKREFKVGMKISCLSVNATYPIDLYTTSHAKKSMRGLHELSDLRWTC